MSSYHAFSRQKQPLPPRFQAPVPSPQISQPQVPFARTFMNAVSSLPLLPYVFLRILVVKERKREEIKMHDLTTSAHQTFYRHERPSLANLSTTTVLQQSLELKCRFQARLEARMLPCPSIHYVFLPSLITKKKMQALASVHYTLSSHEQPCPCEHRQH